MVAGRDTLIFGIRGRAGNPIDDRSRKIVHLEAETDATTEVPVHIEIRLKGRAEPIFVDPNVTLVPLDPPCEPNGSFFIEVDADASNGIPPVEQGPAFTIPAGDYELVAELYRADGSPTGIKVTVRGKSVNVPGMNVLFVPMWLLPPPTRTNRGSRTRSLLENQAEKLAFESSTFITDYYPLEPGSILGLGQEIIDNSGPMTKFLEQATEEFGFGLFTNRTIQDKRAEILAAALSDRVGSLGILGYWDRVVVVLATTDLDLIAPPGSAKAGFAETDKLVFVSTGAQHWDVGHEIAHTLPRHLWSRPEMEKQCKQNYHNQDRKVAHGFRITEGGVENREPRWKNISIMESGSDDLWISQCTYWNLLDALQSRVDPPVILVRGLLARNQDQNFGKLFPAYQIESDLDPVADPNGDWSVALRDANNAILSRYPFSPTWGVNDDTQRDVLAFRYRIPDLPGVAKIDLVGPNGVLDSLTLSANPPTVTITAPDPDTPIEVVDGQVAFAWIGSDPDGGEIRYSTFYSADEGESWSFGAFEQSESQTTMKVDQEAGTHMFKVTATDGVRSSETVLRFTLPIVADVEEASPTASESQASDEDSPAPSGGACAAPGGHSDRQYVGPYMLLGLLGLLAFRRRRGG